MSHIHVLYVEDDATSRKVMEMLLHQQAGFMLTEFEDSTDFLLRVKDLVSPPDIILLDIHVHPYDGFEMLQMLREEEMYQNIPVVALTASVMAEEVEQLQSASFDGTIAKPIDRKTFPDLIRQVLSGETVWHIT
jgi:CheY-like chemotaxis protein